MADAVGNRPLRRLWIGNLWVYGASEFSRRIKLGRKHLQMLATAFAKVLYFRLLLTVRPYHHIARSIRLRNADPSGQIKPLVAAWAVKHTAKLVPGAECLAQALALQYILAVSGLAAHIRIGVAQPAGQPLEAHAWVLYDGAIILGGSDESIAKYAVLTDLHPLPFR